MHIGRIGNSTSGNNPHFGDSRFMYGIPQMSRSSWASEDEVIIKYGVPLEPIEIEEKQLPEEKIPQKTALDWLIDQLKKEGKEQLLNAPESTTGRVTDDDDDRDVCIKYGVPAEPQEKPVLKIKRPELAPSHYRRRGSMRIMYGIPY